MATVTAPPQVSLKTILVATDFSRCTEPALCYAAALAREEKGAAQKYASLPAGVVVLGDSAALRTAQDELIRGVRGMLGKTLRAGKSLPQEKAILLGTLAEVHAAAPALPMPRELREDGFALLTGQVRGFEGLVVTATTDRGVLYGVFALLRKMALGEEVAKLNERQEPYAPVRWVDEWDNLDGTIERGYAGPSIFFANGEVRSDLSRARDYARLLASPSRSMNSGLAIASEVTPH